MPEADVLARLDRIDARLDAMEGSTRPLLVSRKAAAATLGISLRTFEAKVERDVRTVRIGRAVRVLAADLERLVAERAR